MKLQVRSAAMAKNCAETTPDYNEDDYDDNGDDGDDDDDDGDQRAYYKALAYASECLR